MFFKEEVSHKSLIIIFLILLVSNSRILSQSKIELFFEEPSDIFKDERKIEKYLVDLLTYLQLIKKYKVKIAFLRYFKTHKNSCSFSECGCKELEIKIGIFENSDKIIVLKKIIKQDILKLIEKFPNNTFLQFYFIYFNKIDLKNNFICNFVRGFKNLKKQQNFQISKLIEEINKEERNKFKKTNKNETNIDFYEKFLMIKKIKNKITQYLKLVFLVTSYLSYLNCKLDVLLKLLKTLYKENNKIAVLFKRASNLSEIKTSKFYLNYLILTFSDYNKLQEMISELKTKFNYEDDFFKENFKNCDLNKKGLLIVSGEKKKIGTIKYINQDLKNILSYGNENLENSKIEMFMLDIIKKSHNKFIQEFYEFGEKNKVDKVNEDFLVDKNGLLIFTKSLIKTNMDFFQGIKFIGVFVIDNFYENQNIILYNPKDCKYLGTNKSCLTNYGIMPNIEDLSFVYDNVLFEIFANFNSKKDEFEKSKHCECLMYPDYRKTLNDFEMNRNKNFSKILSIEEQNSSKILIQVESANEYSNNSNSIDDAYQKKTFSGKVIDNLSYKVVYLELIKEYSWKNNIQINMISIKDKTELIKVDVLQSECRILSNILSKEFSMIQNKEKKNLKTIKKDLKLNHNFKRLNKLFFTIIFVIFLLIVVSVFSFILNQNNFNKISKIYLKYNENSYYLNNQKILMLAILSNVLKLEIIRTDYANSFKESPSIENTLDYLLNSELPVLYKNMNNLISNYYEILIQTKEIQDVLVSEKEIFTNLENKEENISLYELNKYFLSNIFSLKSIDLESFKNDLNSNVKNYTKFFLDNTKENYEKLSAKVIEKTDLIFENDLLEKGKEMKIIFLSMSSFWVFFVVMALVVFQILKNKRENLYVNFLYSLKSNCDKIFDNLDFLNHKLVSGSAALKKYLTNQSLISKYLKIKKEKAKNSDTDNENILIPLPEKNNNSKEKAKKDPNTNSSEFEIKSDKQKKFQEKENKKNKKSIKDNLGKFQNRNGLKISKKSKLKNLHPNNILSKKKKLLSITKNCLPIMMLFMFITINVVFYLFIYSYQNKMREEISFYLNFNDFRERLTKNDPIVLREILENNFNTDILDSNIVKTNHSLNYIYDFKKLKNDQFFSGLVYDQFIKTINKEKFSMDCEKIINNNHYTEVTNFFDFHIKKSIIKCEKILTDGFDFGVFYYSNQMSNMSSWCKQVEFAKQNLLNFIFLKDNYFDNDFIFKILLTQLQIFESLLRKCLLKLVDLVFVFFYVYSAIIFLILLFFIFWFSLNLFKIAIQEKKYFYFFFNILNNNY